MRMRRKRSLEERLAGFSDYLIDVDMTEKDSREEITGEEYLKLDELFGFSAPTELEIGCGKGGFIAGLSKQRPEKRYVAVEKTRNVILTACERAREEELANVRFLASGAEYLLRYFPPASIERIYLNFSCPYPRTHNANRRLTHPKFLSIYRTLLKEDGSIVMKTDNAGLFGYSIEQFSTCGFIMRGVTLDLHSSPFNEGNIVTEYEKKFSEMGKPIYRLEAFVR